MLKRRYLALLPLCVLLAACSSKPKTPAETEMASGTGGFLLEPQHNVMQMGGDFANNPAAAQFIDKMVAKHGFDRQQLQEILSQAKRLDYVLRLMDRQAPTGLPPTGPTGAWLRYKKQFITPDNVQNGVVFWNQYQDALNRAYQVYGVPPEIIVGIIGVETRWGRVMGKTRILDALATLSFSYPRRAEYFSSELETFLLMARSESDDPLDLKGSFAGAMGYGQFMPSSYKQYAVDFNGDGHINLWDPVDAIGSVANYFKQHGWVSGDLVAVQALGPRPSRWVTISRPACCGWTSAPAMSTGTGCRTSTPSPATTTAPTTRWPSGSWVWRLRRPAAVINPFIRLTISQPPRIAVRSALSGLRSGIRLLAPVSAARPGDDAGEAALIPPFFPVSMPLVDLCYISAD